MNPGRSSYYGDPVSFVASSPALENESLPTSHLCEENAVRDYSSLDFLDDPDGDTTPSGYFWRGSPSQPPRDTLILYAYHETENARRNAEFFIDHGLHDAADFLFIFNGNDTDLDTLLPTDAPNIKVIRHENRCYDVGAYGEALRDMGDSLKRYKRFILLNASIRGPFVPHWSKECWSEAYLGRVTDTVKLVGMSFNCAPFDRHVQSMILATDRVGLDILLDPESKAFATCPNGHKEAVDVEIGITTAIKKAGYKVDAMMQEFQAQDTFADTCTGEDRNYEGAYDNGVKNAGMSLHPFVNAYYGQGSNFDKDSNSDLSNAALVDRKFLEKIWTWLTRNPEILVGPDRKANGLSLSEVESRNASTKLSQQGGSIDDASPVPQNRVHRDSPGGTSSGKKWSKPSTHAYPTNPPAELRLYTTVERRWQAIAGHSPDKVKIPSMDFACLSIIAAYREQGIMQPDLVIISGQDKRSVPERTRRLHVGGYISKTAVLVRGFHTSKLVLSRYTQKSPRGNDAASALNGADDIVRNGDDSTEKEVDLDVLQRRLADILRNTKMITHREIKERMDDGKRDFLLAVCDVLSTMAVSNRSEPKRDWKVVPSFRDLPKPAVAGTHDDLSDGGEDYDAEEAKYLAGIGEGQPLKDLKEVGRPIPQWTGDGTLSNLIFELVDASGTSGISTMELKNTSIGRFFRRPTENLLSRLVDLWQISQPLHLRHLGIVRDTALTNTIPHYVHYSFGNFQKLVDEGKAQWEPVMTITKDHKQFKHVAAIDAEPDLDVNGFPKLPDSLFQGRHNDASLEDCIKGINAPLPQSSFNPQVKKFKDGSWGLQQRVHLLDKRPRNVAKRALSVIDDEDRPQRQVDKRRKIERGQSLLVGAAGRGRKFQADGLPENFQKLPQAQRSRILRSQRAAELYKKSKIVAEIKARLEDGEGRYRATADVLTLATAQYRESGQEPPWLVMEEIRSNTLAPVLLALEGTSPAVCSGQDNLNNSTLLASIVAHSRPLRPIEWQSIGDIFRSRIECLQKVHIEASVQNKGQAGRPDQETMSVGDSIAQNVSKACQGQPLAGAELGGTINAASSPLTQKREPKPRKNKETVRRRGRPKATPQTTSGKSSYDMSLTAKAVADRYLPSVAAHLLPLPPTGLVDAGTSGRKRKRSLGPAPESTRPQRQRKKVDRNLELVPISRTSAPRTRPGNSPQTYQEQSSSIVRHTPGVYLGMECKLNRPGKNGAKRKSRLLIFRFSSSQLLSTVYPQICPAPDTAQAQLQTPQQHMMEMADSGVASQPPSEASRHPYTEETTATSQNRRIVDDEASRDSVLPPPTPTTASPIAGSPSLSTYTLKPIEMATPQHQLSSGRESMHLDQDNTLPLPSDNHSQHKSIPDPISVDQRTLPEIQNGHSEAQENPPDDESSAINGNLEDCQNATHSEVSNQPSIHPNGEDTAHEAQTTDLQVSPEEVRRSSADPLLPVASDQNDPATGLVSDSLSVDDRLALRRTVFTPLADDQTEKLSNSAAEVTKATAPASSPTCRSPEAPSPRLLPENPTTENERPVLAVTSKESRRSKANKGVQKMTTKGGTVAALRRKIVMDVVERCGGLFPGVSELGLPFQNEWVKSGHTGKVEHRTVKGAVKYLCDQGKLRQIIFVIEEQGGGAATKSLLTTPEIGTTDPRVVRMREAITKAHPDPYIPDEAEVPPEIRQEWKPSGRKGRPRMRKMKDLEIDEAPVHLPETPLYIQKQEYREEVRIELEEYWDAVVRLIEANEGTLPEDEDIMDEDIKAFLGTSFAVRRLSVLFLKPKGAKPRRKVDRLASLVEDDADPQAARWRFVASPKEEALRRIEELRRKKAQRESKSQDSQLNNDGTTIRRPPRFQMLTRRPKLSIFRRFEPGSTEAKGIKRKRAQLDRMDKTLHSWAARQQMYTIMEPDHIFHPATGTYSTNFSRFRTPNQIMRRYPYHTFVHSHGTKLLPTLKSIVPPPSTKRRRSDAFRHSSRQTSGPGTKFKTRQLTAIEKIVRPTKNQAAVIATARSYLDRFNHRKKREPAPDAERARLIMTAVTVVRTLVGGVQQNIDWVLVAQALPPEYTQEAIHLEWEKVRKTYSNQVQQIESEFQTLFLKAYSEDLVPPIDYDDLQSYDWAWLVEWTITNLGKLLDEALDLPSDRGRLHELFDLSTSEDPNLNGYYEFDNYVTVAKREATLHKRAWVQPLINPALSHLPLNSSPAKIETIEVAKTWIRAVMVTKAESYTPRFAASQLSRFPDVIQHTALTEMLADRTLMQENKGRTIPGRNYDLNESYLRPLRKKIEAATFRKAPHFKQQIDEALARGGGEMVFPHMADDAFAMAVWNMHAHGRISLHAKNPPREAWGMGGVGEYRTRNIDKERFIFEVGVSASPTYITGNPLEPMPPPPGPTHTILDPKDTSTKLPLWIDLHGEVVMELWELCLAAVVAVIAMRPGASAGTLEESLGGCLGGWEVGIVVGWCLQAGVVRLVDGGGGEGEWGKGVVTGEWWWLCFG
ncbi:MAG: hypothetical protein LQ350_006035 [Teloschistes chrysophthalmus]|nr:MAG: hypothetical protein LQ350_006035 [Niorma chrysophthalma]